MCVIESTNSRHQNAYTKEIQYVQTNQETFLFEQTSFQRIKHMMKSKNTCAAASLKFFNGQIKLPLQLVKWLGW